MAATPTLIWLICCLVIVLGLVGALVVALVRHARGDVATTVPSWPDFAIIDRGDQIHFVPLDDDGHVLESGSCPCRPRRTANRRRSGRRIVYVDHQCRDRHTAVG